MSKAKKFALAGNVLRTLVFILSVFTTISFFISPEASPELVEALEVFSAEEVAHIKMITGVTMVVIQFLTLLLLIFTWFAYKKIDTEQERGWAIFLLVIGIMSCFSLTGVLAAPFSSLLALSSGVCFILTFVFREERNKDETKKSNM